MFGLLQGNGCSKLDLVLSDPVDGGFVDERKGEWWGEIGAQLRGDVGTKSWDESFVGAFAVGFIHWFFCVFLDAWLFVRFVRKAIWRGF